MKTNTTKLKPKDIILDYIKNLDSLDYKKASSYLNDKIKIHGPAGEQFTNPIDFINMLEKFKGKYDIEKVFTDENDVCVLYNLKTSSITAYMSSWYKIEDGKITFVKTIFDSKLFFPPT